MIENSIVKWKMQNTNFIHYLTNSKEKNIKITLVLEVGSINDGRKKGIAHFLEHMLIVSLKKYSSNEMSDFSIIGTTDFDKTTYTITCKNTDYNIKKSLSIIMIIYTGKLLDQCYLEDVRKEVLKEYNAKLILDDSVSILQTITQDTLLLYTSPVGTKECINEISFSDLQEFHNKTYTNANVLIVASCNSCVLYQHVNNVIKQYIINHYSESYYSRTPIIGNVRKKWIFGYTSERKYKIYIKDIDINSTIDKPIDKKTLEDFTIVIIDYCLRHSSSICYVNVSKKRFSKLLCFLFIEIQFDSSYVYNDLSEAYISLFLHDTIFNLFNYELFSLIITSYISQIENIQLSIEELNNELISYILYSEPLFSSDEYIKSLSKITYHDIQRKLIELCE